MVMFISGCSMVGFSKYPDIIHNDRKPLISVTYDYGEIEINIPLYYPRYKPDNIAFQVYADGDTIFPLLSVIQDPLDQVSLFLPHGVLNLEDSTNILKIMPQDFDFRTLVVPFKGIVEGRIELPINTIDFKPLIVRGQVMLAKNDSTLKGVDLAIQIFPTTLATTKSGTDGLFELGIPGEFMKSNNIELVAGTNLIFKPFRQNLDFSKTKGIFQDVRIGPSKTMGEPLYITNKHNVHLRENPDIGSTTKFLLPKGESFSVKRTTRGELFGDVEVLLQDGKMVVFEGWVAREDLKLMEIKNIFLSGIDD